MGKYKKLSIKYTDSLLQYDSLRNVLSKTTRANNELRKELYDALEENNLLREINDDLKLKNNERLPKIMFYEKAFDMLLNKFNMGCSHTEDAVEQLLDKIEEVMGE